MPVDFDGRRRLLRHALSQHSGGFMSLLKDGAPKLRLIATALAVRSRHPEAFGRDAGYERIAVSGSRADHAICFSRTRSDGFPVTLTVGFRWPLLLRAGWQDTTVTIPGGRWREVLTDREVEGETQHLETLLDEAPIALLERA
jgi:(1->4)-alpha-D-glucan 1-alpha-D-glucosylmutase